MLTPEEHLFLLHTLMNVRDELQDLCRRDENLKAYVTDVNDCLRILGRPSLYQALMPTLAERRT
jgi:hypothetical protein